MWLRMSPLLMFMAHADVSIIDASKDDRYTYIAVNECEVPILKEKLNDWCYILKETNKYCMLELNEDECNVK